MSTERCARPRLLEYSAAVEGMLVVVTYITVVNRCAVLGHVLVAPALEAPETSFLPFTSCLAIAPVAVELESSTMEP